MIWQKNNSVWFLACKIVTYIVDEEGFKNVKGVIRIRKSKNRQHNRHNKKKTKGQTTIYKILHTKLKIEQHSYFGISYKINTNIDCTCNDMVEIIKLKLTKKIYQIKINFRICFVTISDLYTTGGWTRYHFILLLCQFYICNS